MTICKITVTEQSSCNCLITMHLVIHYERWQCAIRRCTSLTYFSPSVVDRSSAVVMRRGPLDYQLTSSAGDAMNDEASAAAICVLCAHRSRCAAGRCLPRPGWIALTYLLVPLNCHSANCSRKRWERHAYCPSKTNVWQFQDQAAADRIFQFDGCEVWSRLVVGTNYSGSIGVNLSVSHSLQFSNGLLRWPRLAVSVM